MGRSAAGHEDNHEPSESEDDNDFLEAEKGDDPLCPTIRLTKMELKAIRAPWRQALIVKVMGRKVGYTYLQRRLASMWKPKRSMDLIAIDNDYFLVRFGSVDDMEFAMYEGPWMVLGHYLIVKPWEPNFDPFNDTVEKVFVWIRVPSLPAEYFDFIFLRKLGNKLGRTVRVDQATSLVSRGMFARVCMEIDMRKPLVSKFTHEGKVQQVEYEGMHLVCFACGLYGHAKEACPTLRGEETGQCNDVSHGQNKNATNAPHVSADAMDPKVPFGAWMIAPTRRGRPTLDSSGRNNRDVHGRAGMSIAASKFAPLRESGDEDHGEEGRPEDVVITNADLGDKRPHQTGRSNGEAACRDSMLAGSVRARRPNVIAIEQQITNEPEKGQRSTTDKAEAMPKVRRSNGGSSRKAAGEDEHVVVRGSQGGLVIRSSRVYVGDTGGISPSPVWQHPMEHHGDPPEEFDEEGDVVMDLHTIQWLAN
ncbi:PREDICTED: uncharacterized protein LOC109146642 [Ipomoea nil]|uniref:uncharacterized protein LOC109146642 n=1 Tax=Ipomoea nil TaxID=35883 RepID=UPI0009014A96|nr:PREDICTED: uncharacterized protein LOC109146642 [Ipomoea nil]